MVNQIFYGQKAKYKTSRLLGRGGEGQVFDVADDSSLVLKVYIEPLSDSKIRKLQLMASIANNQAEAYAAWPVDVVSNGKGEICGFAMKKLNNYVPLHMLFSPMDRKKIFPDKGYNFLLHVARNLAAAFHSLHGQGLIVGDVNEGNILVNQQGMVAFIDCDSFQIKDTNDYFFCEVGVPRYTAPELLNLPSFQNVVRTVNTDTFSMAVLIFQLLFLGRHPFAGINTTAADIDEETGIKRHLFAYSLNNHNKIILPPKDSFDINNLSNGLIQLFHESFETNIRPEPAKWIRELTGFLQQMTNCKISKIHVYPSKLTSCPWCDFKNRRNILYFIDDTYLADNNITKDFEKFVHGFKIEPLRLASVDMTFSSKDMLTPTPIDSKFRSFKTYKNAATGVLLLAGLALFFINVGAGFIGLIVAITLINFLPWKMQIATELKTRKAQYVTLKQNLENTIKDYHSNNDIKKYNQTCQVVEKLIEQFKGIPNEIQLKKRATEEKLYQEQLHSFLRNFLIKDHTITSFGAARKLTLQQAGIESAADVFKLKNIKVQGIGPKYEEILFSWQRQIMSTFIYQPNNNILNTAFLKILEEAAQTKKRLENEISYNYQTSLQLKSFIMSRQAQLMTHINSMKEKYYQAEIDYKEFEKHFAK